VSLSLDAGETLGVVGESGSGKSLTALSILRLLPAAAHVASGSIAFDGTDLLALDEASLRDLRGNRVSVIFQEPVASLNPLVRIGDQVAESLRLHRGATAASARAEAVAMLARVGIADPERRAGQFPFELSGGMCQRVMIAIALACKPRLLIADEPTTGLDVTTQKAIVDLLVALAARRGMATVLITHDLALASERCSRLAVMQGGRVVEIGETDEILHQPRQPYTRSLIAATPRADEATTTRQCGTLSVATAAPLLSVESLRRDYRLRTGDGLVARARRQMFRKGKAREDDVLRAVDNVTFSLSPGESVGLVGESGSGKSTLAALVVRLIDPTAGHIAFRGDDIGVIPARRAARAPYRRDIQMVFQDPSASLNPRQTVFAAIAEPIRRLGPLKRDRPLAAVVHELAEMVGLPSTLLGRLPHQLSGGERARAGIARAIALRPSLLVLDEPTASLDVRVQAVILDLLAKLRAEFGMTYLFVSHDLAVVVQSHGVVNRV